MTGGVPGGPPWAGDGRGRWVRFLRMRIWLYVVIVLVILGYRLSPSFRRLFSGSQPPPATHKMLILAGLNLAPALIPRLAEGFRATYPKQDIRILGGGTKQALEALANSEADVAFLNRVPTPEERKAMAPAVDSVCNYSVALGGIAVLSAAIGGPDSLTMSDLKAWFHGEPAAKATRPTHFYVPDPNLGLWSALLIQFGLGEDATVSGVVFLADEEAVARAAAAEPSGLGFASTFSLLQDLERIGAKEVRLRGETGTRAVLPRPGDIAGGGYPLYHYLYLSCRPDPDPQPRTFVDFMVNGRGQRLVEREGYLPARQVARIVQIVQKPLS
jgi:ABC-type phosphate transport system substrate-binding protein